MSRCLRPAQDGADAGVELGCAERLGEEVVGAGVERAHGRGVVVSGRGDDDGHLADCAQHPEQLGAVEIGQPEVEHDDVGRCPRPLSAVR